MADQMAQDNGTYASVDDALAELDRRDAARAKPQAEQDSDDQSDDQLPDDQAAQDENEEVEQQEQEQDQEQKDSAPKLEEVEYEGKKYLLPPELKGAVLRQADYTRKTQEVAQMREQTQAARAELWQQAQQVQQSQTILAQYLQGLVGEAPPLSMAQEDPQRYLLERGMHEQRQQALNELMQHGQTLTAQQQHLNQQAMAEFQQREVATLLEKMPELADQKGYQEFTAKAVEVGSQYGFTAQELAAITDHRMILALRDLAKLKRENQSREKVAGDVKQKLANVPPRVGKPGVAQNQDGKSDRAAKAKARFMASARTDKDARRWAQEAYGD